jgi:hypothetical protein
MAHLLGFVLFYEADAPPPRARGRYITADLLDHSVQEHDIPPLGSTFQAKQAGDLLRANDTWFAPTDIVLGLNGRLYIAGWHDRRTAHPDPDANWDRSNGEPGMPARRWKNSRSRMSH